MKKSVRLRLIQSITVMALLATAAVAGAGTTLTANQALSTLLSGNSPYLTGNFAALSKNAQPAVRTTLVAGQSPYAVILGCSDSRVSPEIIFDKGLGEVFPVRVAGNIIADHEIGTIEYGVEHLCAPLVVVMGHTKCGAVTAAVNTFLPQLVTSGHVVTPALVPPVGGNYINSLLNTLIPPVNSAYLLVGNTSPLIDTAIDENIKFTAADLLVKSAIVKEAVEVGMPAACITPLGSLPVGAKARLVGAKYDVTTGKVSLVPLAP